MIIVGFRKDLNITEFEFPVPRNYRVTMREALKNIPEPEPDEVCNAPYSSRYMSRNRKEAGTMYPIRFLLWLNKLHYGQVPQIW